MSEIRTEPHAGPAGAVIAPARAGASTAPAAGSFAAAVLAASTLAIFASACSEPPPALSVGPVAFSQDRLLGLSDSRRRTLADLAGFGLAVADSTTDALGEPLVSEWLDDRLLEILAAELTLEQHDIGDDVLQARYLTNPEWELTVRHILFFSERWRPPAERREAQAKAERALEALKAGADFAATAATLSEEPGAEARQGLLTPGREGSWVPEFWAAALALQPGEISPVTETEYGYHILRLEDREVVPFEEARSKVARAVAKEVGDPDEVLEAWMSEAAETDEAQRAAALAEAKRRGLAVPEPERAELDREWDDRVYQLSTSLGFRSGLAPTQVADAAMAALANSAQNADLARRELAEYRKLIDAAYPVSFGGSGG